MAGLTLLAMPVCASQPRVETDLSGSGWKLWLDKNAKWENDGLFLPPVDVARLPVNPPTGGWDVLNSAKDVSVPGTVEEYLHPGNGPAGDIKGVSWWTRTFKIPEAGSPRRLILHFDAVRLRAEIFVNWKLVGYDVVGNTPFDVDITGAVKPGEECELAVRVTDPGGNFDWRDSAPFMWGTNTIPMSHGFGGITGRVRLVSSDSVFVDDIYVQNTPAITNVNVIATVKNSTDKIVQRDVQITVTDKSDVDRLNELLKSGGLVDYLTPLTFHSELKNVQLKPGDNTVTFQVSPRGPVKLWDLEHPNLYVCEVDLDKGQARMDYARQTFGFRWFAPEGFGSDAMFRLNGRRIVLRTSISWGFWPVNGIFPTPELAEKQIESAKALGLNMLNFHRCIGQPEVLDDADKLGLLYYEEPGAYVNGDKTPFAQALAREKLLRMVKRDRSHPSLVIYNMINEAWDSGGASKDKAVLDGHIRDMRDAHALDPSRTITHTSAWALKADDDELPKMHMRPFDNTLYFHGWFDNHHAGGPEVWRQNIYQSPDKYYNRTTNRSEIVYWGEEGAISSPPRLEKIKAELAAAPYKGWDGPVYLDWYRQFDDFLTRKNLRAAFPTVDALTTSMGAVSLYHQGRKIETIRINDATDGYAVNGWESEIIDDHSGIVDCFRNPKADPAIMAYYNQPLYVAVKTRSQFAQIPGKVTVDFYVINEKNLRGPHTLEISVKNPAGREMSSQSFPVALTGGDVYGELLKAGIEAPIAGATGIFRIEASLLNEQGQAVATGHDEVLAVDWKSEKLGGKGATWENGSNVRNFLQREKGLKVESYRDDLGPLDWVVVTRPPGEGETVEIPADRFESALAATFYSDERFQNKIHERTYPTVDYFVPDGAAPDQQSSFTENYGVRWDGTILPPAAGDYTFAVESSGGARLWVNGKLLFDDFYTRNNPVNRARIRLEAGQAVAVRVEFWQRKGDAQCKLLWAVPEADAPSAAKLIERVKNDGTTLFILDRADTWMNLVTNNTSAKFNGSFQIGTAWLGGLHFVREHPLFKDLPVNTAMDWPYQAVVRDGKARSGLLLEGEELVAGAWHCYPMELGTAVGIIPCGKGRIVVSTLDIAGQLNSSDSSAEVARKLLCNFIAFHNAPASGSQAEK
ncbi:MAG TPA: PA14 domain-containing protein [Verrucomicrobiae bacterium]|jgi:hypothetical protein